MGGREWLPSGGLLLLSAACTVLPPSPEEAACLGRMERHVVVLLPAFIAMGYQVPVELQLDEAMLDNRGFRKPSNVLGDALAGGRIRLRPSQVCGDEALARGVIAHEMAHVALGHMGVVGTGLTLAWERPPQQEIDADALGYMALQRSGSDPRAAEFLPCRAGDCSGLPAPPAIRPGLPTPMRLP